MAVEAPTLACQKRELASKSYLNTLKKNENIPGIVYGKEQNPIPITIGARDAQKVFNSYGIRGIFSLNLDGEAKPFMSVVREIQKHPITGKITHIDFMTISMTEKFTSVVPVHVIGEEAAAKEGGIVQFGLKEIEVECLPKDLPENITIDISDLAIGSNVAVSDLEQINGVTFLSDLEAVIVTVLAPSKATTDDEDTGTGETDTGNAADGTPAGE